MNGRILVCIIAIVATVAGLVSCLNRNDHQGGPVLSGVEGPLPKTVSFNFHIRPILSDKCFKCHGPDAAQRQAGLRLDIADSAYAPLKESKGAFALVPGDVEHSMLYQRISSDDTAFMMPTPESHLGALNEYEIKLFKKVDRAGCEI